MGDDIQYNTRGKSEDKLTRMIPKDVCASQVSQVMSEYEKRPSVVVLVGAGRPSASRGPRLLGLQD
jgi:hypothetical protein